MSLAPDFVTGKRGRLFTSELGVTCPDVDTMNLNVAPENWDIFSDMKGDGRFTIEKAGGEVVLIPTQWDPAADSDTAAATFSATGTGVNLNIDLFDAAFGGYFDEVLQRYVVPTTAVPITKQILFVWVDGKNRRLGLLVERCEISGGEAPVTPEDGHIGFPLKFTFLTGLTSDSAMAWVGKVARPRDAVVEAKITTGGVKTFTVTDGGQRYKNAPTVVITGDGTGATATATIDTSGKVTAVTSDVAGTGYTAATVALTRVP